ncbi:Hypothetical protein, putative [Bodo saltans]|uniref:WW domain-containing protein n=1 Tax=Bodo saltans TaxID=75058 RepID=A0A0S4IPX6_BODSA|nr:Hypothetical protein, putative [Bodo saltans]|eukprot:CUE71973.1 Hypothetical protein, putative [Bodo saltans]
MSGLTAEEFAEDLIRRGVWKAVVDREGERRTYYFNSTTKERVWDLVSLVVRSKLHEKPRTDSPRAQPASINISIPSDDNIAGSKNRIPNVTAALVTSQADPSAVLEDEKQTGALKKESSEKKHIDKAANITSSPVVGSKSIPAKTSSSTNIIDSAKKSSASPLDAPRPMVVWQRREAVRILSEAWHPSHRDDSMTLLMCLSLYRCDVASSHTSSNPTKKLASTQLLEPWPSSPSAVNFAVVASIPPAVGGAPQMRSGCFQATFSPSANTGSPRGSSLSTAPLFSVEFCPIGAQSSSVISVLFDYIVLVEDKASDASGSATVVRKSVCWALVRRKQPLTAPLVDLDCVAVFTMVTVSALSVPWRICCWDTSVKSPEILRQAQPQPSENSKPIPSWCLILNQTSCSPKCIADIRNSVEGLRHHQSMMLSVATKRSGNDSSPVPNRLTEHTPALKNQHSHLSSLLHEALSSPRASLNAASRHHVPHATRVMAVTPVQRKQETPTNRRLSRTPAAAFAPRTATALFLDSPSVYKGASQNEGLFDAIMHQLDAVADIMGH